MKVEFRKHILRDDVQAEPDKIFLFGDNMLRKGYGGQAGAMRGEPNAIGIPTKWKPTMEHDAFFTDNDFGHETPVYGELRATFYTISKHFYAGKTIVIPEDGIGTGLAELPTRAPKIYRYIKNFIDYLSELSDNEEHNKLYRKLEP
jgi:hypothetical protein